ncbi:MAG: magnesium transporter [Leptospiraceae bacterium]|nr:magnesium transporter [Leptospiraceae bacterium]MCB1201980.1 magnesium transporter [Leptospiraceae bacterium]
MENHSSLQLPDLLSDELTRGEALSRLIELRDIEIAEILEELENEDLLSVLPALEKERRGAIVSEFDMDRQIFLFEHTEPAEFSDTFEHMYPESRADLYQNLSRVQQVTLLPYLPKNVRTDVIKLSSYPPETAGGIMTTDFATVQQKMTIENAIRKVRKDAPSKKMVYYIYVVNSEMKLQGFVTLKDLIMAEPDVQVKDILHEEFVYASIDEDRETVARKIEKYDLVAIPVINDQGQLLGIVTHDEALEIIRAEHTEDLEKFMGIVPAKDDLYYLDTSSWRHFKKRVVWIVSLAAVGIVSGFIIHRFENTLQKLLILALYMPMVADTGGNAGSQAATVVVRAMALGQVTARDWWRVIWKETKISVLLAVCLGVIAFGKVTILSWETEIPQAFSLVRIAFAISVALALQVVTSTMIGAGLPLMVKRFGGDPAVAASPAITTTVDITGLLIYFGVATWFFSL